jgi:uncharacterized integral membrane protein
VSESRQRAREAGSRSGEGERGVTRSGSRAVDRRDRIRLIAMTLLGVAIVAFALLNLDEVEVHWLITTGSTPLIVVIVVSFLAGMLADRLLRRRKLKRSRRSSE